ncbi:MAG: DNA helicase [Pseudomonadota bacterium]
MQISAPIYRLKRQAKEDARRRDVPLHEALDTAAQAEGYQSWGHLSASASARPADRIFPKLSEGDLILIGARPGHGKTLLGLELAVAASRHGWRALFFTLDYTEADVAARLKDLGVDPRATDLIVDTSDNICADHIAARIQVEGARVFAVIDYLQLLDQRRTTPPLDAQLHTLRRCANEGAVVAAISQIDRSFDLGAGDMPTLADVRLPNAADLSLFTKTCFLHNGAVRFSD